jgi:hypothetical protein
MSVLILSTILYDKFLMCRGSLDPRTSDQASDSTVLRDVNLFDPLPLLRPFPTWDLNLFV